MMTTSFPESKITWCETGSLAESASLQQQPVNQCWTQAYAWRSSLKKKKKKLPAATETYYVCPRLHGGVSEVTPLGTKVLKA